MNSYKKLLSMILTICLLFSMLPTHVFAEEIVRPPSDHGGSGMVDGIDSQSGSRDETGTDGNIGGENADDKNNGDKTTEGESLDHRDNEHEDAEDGAFAPGSDAALAEEFLEEPEEQVVEAMTLLLALPEVKAAFLNSAAPSGGDGTKEYPCSTFADAYQALGPEGGIVVICNNITFAAANVPGIPVTFTSRYGEDSYPQAVMTLSADFTLAAHMSFEHITITPTAARNIYAAGFPLSFGEGVVKGGTYALNLFGGKNNAALTGNTEMFIASGTFGTVYGGGTGINGTVTGDANLTITGGTIATVYGGGNTATARVGGNSYVEVSGGTVTNIYGGGNAAPVSGDTNMTITSGIITTVYGGGNAATATTASSYVEISGGEIANIYGGGNSGSVTGDVYLEIGAATVKGNIFGGGNTGAVDGDINTTIDGMRDNRTSGAIYGGCTSGEVGGDVSLTVKNTTTTRPIYGGGGVGVKTSPSATSPGAYTNYLAPEIKGGVTLLIEDCTLAAVFGGSAGSNAALACSATTNWTVVLAQPIIPTVKSVDLTIRNSTLNGEIGGSGEYGEVSRKTTVRIEDCTLSAANINIYGGAKGNVYNAAYKSTSSSAANDAYAWGGFIRPVTHGVEMTIDNLQSKGKTLNVFGGGLYGNVAGDVALTLLGGGKFANVYGGGAYSSVEGDIAITLDGGADITTLYAGGGEGARAADYGAVGITAVGYHTQTASVKGDTALYIKDALIKAMYASGKGLAAGTGTPLPPQLISQTQGDIGIHFNETSAAGQYGYTKLAANAEISGLVRFFQDESPVVSAGDIGGTGTAADPYRICSATDLYRVANVLGGSDTVGLIRYFNYPEGVADELTYLKGAHYQLQNDIAVQNYTEKNGLEVWNGYYGIPNFGGSFDGNHKTVTLDLKCDYYVGLAAIGGVFANLNNGASVKDLTLAGQMTGELVLGPSLTDLGLLCGGTNYTAKKIGTIKNIVNHANINITLDTLSTYTTYIAAIVGRSNTGGVLGTEGLAIENCVNHGDLTVNFLNTAGNSSRLAGLVGHAYPGTVIRSCENAGTITAQGTVASQVGDLIASGNVVYLNCVSGGSVHGTKTDAVIFGGMQESTTEAEGNQLRITVTGKVGERITCTATGETKVIPQSGAVVFALPACYKDGVKKNCSFNIEGSFTLAGGGKMFWFSFNKKHFTAQLNTADAAEGTLPFETWDRAIPLSTSEDFLALQKAINEADPAAISALYGLGGLVYDESVTDLETARITLRGAYYTLENDVTVDSQGFSGIGTDANYFGGRLDGKGHTLTLKMDYSPESISEMKHYGLFGVIKPLFEETVTVKNLRVRSNIKLCLPPTSYTVQVGGLCGSLVGPSFENLTVIVDQMEINQNGTGTTSLVHCGGLAGTMFNDLGDSVATKINCTMQVSGMSGVYIGGLSGASANHGGKVEFIGGEGMKTSSCANTRMGGIVGYSSGPNNFTGSSVVNSTGHDISLEPSGSTTSCGILQGYQTTVSHPADYLTVVIDDVEIKGAFHVTAKGAGGLVGDIVTSGIISIEDAVLGQDITIKGADAASHIGGLVGNINSPNGKAEIENCAAAANLIPFSTTPTRGGGLLGSVTVSKLSFADCAFVKYGTLNAAISTVNEEGVYAIDPTVCSGAKTFGDTAALVVPGTVGAAKPAALSAMGPGELSASGVLTYTKAETGKMTLSWRGAPFYTSGDILVNPKALSPETVTVAGYNNVYKYTGDAITPLVSVAWGNTTLGKDTDFTLTYGHNTNIGPEAGSITITFKGNYSGAVTKTFAIDESAMEVKVENYSGLFDGGAHGISVTAPAGAEIRFSVDGSTYSSDTVSRVNAGHVTVYYTVTKTGYTTVGGTASITIEKAAPSLSFGAAYMSCNPESPSFVNPLSGIMEGAAVTYTSSDPDVATVEPDGTVTIAAVGRAIITAVSEETANYRGVSAKYTISVTNGRGGGLSGTRDTSNKTETAGKGEEAKDNKAADITVVKGPDGTEAVKVELKAQEKRAVVAVPCTSAAKGAVAVATYPDGSSQIIKFALVTDEGVKLLLSDSAVITFVDNSKSFRDIAQDAWYEEAAAFVSATEIMNGMGDGLFSPDSTMTRGMLVQILFNMEERPAASSDSFADVNPGSWFSDAVTWATEHSIAGGYGNGQFGPEDQITREQTALMLYKYAGYIGLHAQEREDLAEFADGEDTSGWAVDAMEWAVGCGLLKGNEDGNLNPKGAATRAEIAQILLNLRDIVLK